MCGGEGVRVGLIDLKRVFVVSPWPFVLLIGRSRTKFNDRLAESDMVHPRRRNIRPNPIAFDLAAV